MTKSPFSSKYSLLAIATFAILSFQTGRAATSQWVYPGTSGTLTYKNITTQGDRIVDYSAAGYGGGGVRIPTAAVMATVSPSGNDDTSAIQSAINTVSALPLGANGMRGAVFLEPGTFICSGTININASGVVLRGAGPDLTTISMTGNSSYAISVSGSGSAGGTGSTATFTDSYVPCGATSFNVSSTSGFSVGESVLVKRVISSQWIAFMGMNQILNSDGSGNYDTWLSPGDATAFPRHIAAISGNNVTVDIPLTDSFDQTYAIQGTMVGSTFTGQISNVGIESLTLAAPLSNGGPAFHGFSFNASIDCWARDIITSDMIESASISQSAYRTTLDDMTFLHTVGIEQAPYPGEITLDGPQSLLNNLYEETADGYLAILTNQLDSGPIVMLNCTFGHGLGTHQRWDTGYLFDNDTAKQVGFQDLGNEGSGHGWTAGWSVAWNCIADTFLIQMPPGSANFNIGGIGTNILASEPGSTTGTNMPQGYIDSPNVPVTPSSLYLAQLNQRLGPQALSNIGYGGNDTVSGATYQLISHGSGMYLAAAGNSVASGAAAVQSSANGGDGQIWEADQQPDGYWRFTSQGSDMALSVSGTGSGASVVQSPWTGASTQEWQIINLTNGYYQVWSRSGYLLEVGNSATADQAPCDQAAYSGANSQEWALVPATTVYQTLQAYNPSLVASYPFSEGSGTTTADATGNGFTATLTGATWTTGIEGTPGISFTGTSTSYGTLPALNLNSSTVTITGWINRNGTQTTDAGIVFSRAGGTSGVNFNTGNALGYMWNGLSSTYSWNSGLVVPSGQWTFFALVITPANATMYMQPLGGSMTSATNNVANAVSAFNGVTNLGCDSYSTARYFKGAMDAVRIYNAALSPAAIADLALTGPVVDTGNTLAPATGTTDPLSVLGTSSSAPASSLSYTWSVVSSPSGATAPTFSVNGTNAAQNTTATFHAAGVYTLQAKVTDATGASVTSNENVTIAQTPGSVTVTPVNPSVTAGGSVQLSATTSGVDQFGAAMASQVPFTWALASGIGSVSSSGLYTVATGTSGTASITATTGGTTGSDTITVNALNESIWNKKAGGSWATSSNWANGTIPSATGAIADFSTLSLTSSPTVTLDSSPTVGALYFGDKASSYNWKINPGSGSTLTLAASSGTPTITVNNETTTLAVALAGTQGFTVGGSGTLILSGANTFTGTATINPGATLQINGGSGGSSLLGTNTVAVNGALIMNENDGGNTFQIKNSFTGSGVVNFPNVGSGFTQLLGGYSSFSGTLNIGPNGGGGPFEFSTGGSLGRLPATATVNVLNGNAFYEGQANIQSCHLNLYGGWAGSDGQLTLVSGAGWSGPIALFSNSSIGSYNTTAATTTISGVISEGAGPCGIAYSGSGSTVAGDGITVSGMNTYTGLTSIDGFTLIANSTQALGIGSEVSITNAALSTLQLNYPTTIGSLAGGGTTGGNIVLNGSGTVNAADSASLTINGGASQTFSGVISNAGGYSGGVTYSGLGTQTLAGANTYTGPTLVSSGNLQVTGSLAAGSAVTVATGAGAILSGTGTIHGPITVYGHIAPGTTNIGTLHATGVVTLAHFADFGISKSGTTLSSDKLTGMSSLNVTSGAILTVTNTGSTALAAGDTFTLFSANSYSGKFTTITLPALPTGLVWNTSNLLVNGSISVISPVLTTIVVTPASASVNASGTQQFSATGYDQGGNALATQPTFTWAKSGSGSVSSSGLYTASSAAGSCTVTASSGGVSGSASVTIVGPPPAPTGLTATAGNAQVALTWSAATNATSYNIGRATTSGGPYTTIGTGTTTSYTDTTVTNGTTYYYVVSGVDASGTGANSAQVSAKPLAPPAAPAGLSATAGNAQVALTWTAATNATSYNIGRATTSGGPYTTIGTSATTSYTDTTVTNGATYYYVVSGVDATGTGANSAQATATPQGPPAAPTGFSATAGNAQVALTWTAAANATGYNIGRATTSGGPYTMIGSPATTSYTDASVTNGTTYYYVVSGVNASGAGANSAEVSATPLAPPTVATAASASPGTVTGTTTSFSVLGADANGNPASNLTYSWSATTLPTGATAPAFSANGTNAAQNTTATFSAAGAYTFTATITGEGGLTATSTVNVTVNQAPQSVTVTPPTSAISVGQTQQFTASGTDQFGNALAQSSYAWAVTAGTGTVSSTGLYTAPATATTATVTAMAGTVQGSATITVASGLVHEWKFDDGSGTTAADSVGTDNATLTGATWTGGLFNGAIAFNGTSSSYASVPAMNLNSNTVTITGWINLNGTQNAWTGIVFSRASSNVSGLNIGATGNILSYTWNNVAATYNWNSGLTVPANTWTFVALVITPTNATIYMQPQGGTMQSATNTVANLASLFDGTTLLGGDSLAGNRYMNGAMDDTRIYNTSLSAAQVAALGAATPIPGPVDDWKFNDGSGTTAADSGPGGNTGTVNGATWGANSYGGYLNFNGTSGDVTFGTGPSLNGNTDFTVSAWVQTTATTGGTIIQQRDSNGYLGEYQVNTNPNGTVGFYVYGSTGYQWAGNSITTTTAVNDGNWHLVTAVRQGVAGYIYIDGVLAASATTGTEQSLSNTIGVAIGADTRNGNYYFNGAIDGVRIYSQALTAAEISQLDNQSLQ